MTYKIEKGIPMAARRASSRRKGSAAALFRAGKLPGRPSGNRILVSAKRVEELWGAK